MAAPVVFAHDVAIVAKYTSSFSTATPLEDKPAMYEGGGTNPTDTSVVIIVEEAAFDHVSAVGALQNAAKGC